MKALIGAAAILVGLIGPAASAFEMSYTTRPTPYGVQACKNRGQNALFRVGATNIRTGSRVIWADVHGGLVSLWCRGEEVFIVVGNDANASDMVDELKSQF